MDFYLALVMMKPSGFAWAIVLLPVILTLQACQLFCRQQEAAIPKAALYNTQLGLAYLNQGQRVRAKSKLLRALRQAPQAAAVNAAMAYFWELSGELQLARIYYQRALWNAPKNGMQLNNYGAFLCRIGEYQQAEQYFLRAVRDTNYPNTAMIYENAGLCALAMADYVKAKQYFIQALRHDPARKQSLDLLRDLKANRSIK